MMMLHGLDTVLCIRLILDGHCVAVGLGWVMLDLLLLLYE